MTVETTTPPANTDPAAELAAAQENLEKAGSAHQEAAAASDAARAALADLEAAADRGDAVDVGEYTTAKADLNLKSRRTAALAQQVTTAQQAVNAAEKAQQIADLYALADQIPDPENARQKAQKAVKAYLDTVKAQTDAVQALYLAARDLPLIEHPAPEGQDGWPAHTTRYSGGRVKLEGKIGHLILNGQRVRRPYAPDAAEKLADDVRSLASAYRYH